jgi:hypothetical protein
LGAQRFWFSRIGGVDLRSYRLFDKGTGLPCLQRRPCQLLRPQQCSVARSCLHRDWLRVPSPGRPSIRSINASSSLHSHVVSNRPHQRPPQPSFPLRHRLRLVNVASSGRSFAGLSGLSISLPLAELDTLSTVLDTHRGRADHTRCLRLSASALDTALTRRQEEDACCSWQRMGKHVSPQEPQHRGLQCHRRLPSKLLSLHS